MSGLLTAHAGLSLFVAYPLCSAQATCCLLSERRQPVNDAEEGHQRPRLKSYSHRHPYISGGRISICVINRHLTLFRSRHRHAFGARENTCANACCETNFKFCKLHSFIGTGIFARVIGTGIFARVKGVPRAAVRALCQVARWARLQRQAVLRACVGPPLSAHATWRFRRQRSLFLQPRATLRGTGVTLLSVGLGLGGMSSTSG